MKYFRKKKIKYRSIYFKPFNYIINEISRYINEKLYVYNFA